MGLFEANDTSRQKLARQLKAMLEAFGFTSKILCYVKDEGINLGTMTMALKFMISCEVLGLVTAFDNVCFEHTMRKVVQYAINNDKISKYLMLVSVKFVQMSFQSYITWPKKLGLLALFLF
jgi:hypothetical protein